MILDSLELRHTAGSGYGLFASQAIPVGVITMAECAHCGSISVDAARVSDRWDFLCSHAPITSRTYPHFLEPCDPRIYYGNHSCDANTLDTHLGFDIAVRPIAAGEELTVDYRRFLDFTIDFPCRCNAEDCCERVVCGNSSTALEALWEQRLQRAFRRLSTVPQPLLLSARGEPLRRFLAEQGSALDPASLARHRFNPDRRQADCCGSGPAARAR